MVVGRRFSRKSVVLLNGLRQLAAASSLARAGARFGVSAGLMAGLILIGANDSLQTASAEGDTRTLSFRHLHTKETITITYKRNGRYDGDALKKLDWFMRDWRKEQSVRMDPHLFDLLWEVNREVGGQAPIEIICGYRAPGTNAMLRARSTGVAQNSNHISGQAIDFEIPGVPLAKIREVGLRLQRGGVGFYPTSGSPFVHLDTGTIRHWPRMTHDQLVKVFPNGRTVHVPSDGVPLPGYALALADVEARGKEPNGTSLAAARNAGIITTASIENSAKTGAGDNLTAKPSTKPSTKPKRSFRARIFGGGQDEEDDIEQAKPKRGAGPLVLASANAPAKPKPVRVASFARDTVPMPAARPKQADAPVAIAMAENNTLFEKRGLWIGAVESGELPPPVPQSPFTLASVDPASTGSTSVTPAPAALAYAADTHRSATPLPRPARARPMGASLPQGTEAALPSATVAAATFTQRFEPALTGGFGRADSPWLRAAMLTPSVGDAMTVTPMTLPHMEPLATMFYKPAQSLVMTFSADPHLGMVTGHFSGSAVTFLATATFQHRTTASLR
jgi:uncharacterized protein YcbK (DUF882 family)